MSKNLNPSNEAWLVVYCAGNVQGNHYAWAVEKSFASEQEASDFADSAYDAGDNILYYGLESDYVCKYI